MIQQSAQREPAARLDVQAQKGMVAVAEWPSPLAAPPPDTPKQRREGVKEGGRKGPARPVMTKFAAATVYLQARTRALLWGPSLEGLCSF